MTTTDSLNLDVSPDANEALPAMTAPSPREAAGDAPTSAPSTPTTAAAPDEATPPAEGEASAEVAASTGTHEPADLEAEASTQSSRLADLAPDRRRIEEQLAALRRRESELRRELAKADHPELADAIGGLEACVYRVSRADGKLAQGLTKAEQRRRDTLSKKIASLTDKRDSLDAQITELSSELSSLGEERIEGFREERRDALHRLVAHMGAHTAALRAAELDPADLVPEIGDWMDEIREVAEELAATRR